MKEQPSVVLCAVVLLTLSSNTGVCGSPVVHVIPHSHCDAGYRKSFSDYYNSEVKYILSSVMEALDSDPKKTFVWEEVSFFSVWWGEISEEERSRVKYLIRTGQLEFIGGGWVMHDEAVTSAYAIVEQMTLGLTFLNKTLGVRPKVEWHIDPFGHSAFMPELYTQLGYRGVVINRVPNNIKQQMKNQKELEFFWLSQVSNKTIFTHVLDSHYTTPYMIGIDTAEKAQSFVDSCQQRLQWYRTHHLLIPFGGDFAFQNAGSQFKEMDTIIDYINSHQSEFNLTVKYSTLSGYIDSVLSSGATFDTADGDFFPYICCYSCLSSQCGGIKGTLSGNPCGFPENSDSYWSGFYTSKPAQKLLARQQEASLRSLEVLNSLFPYLVSSISPDLQLSRNTTALLQHHDAITGTSYSESYASYNRQLEAALEGGSKAIALLKVAILCGINKTRSLTLSSDSKAILSQLTDTNIAVVVVQNPLAIKRYLYVTITLPEALCVKVLNASLLPVDAQQVASQLYVPLRIPAMALQVLFLSKTQCTQRKQSMLQVSGFSLNNGLLRLEFNGNNHLENWTGPDLRTHSLSHSYVQYVERRGLGVNDCDGSNVYTFVPDKENNTLTPHEIPTTITASGPLVWEAEQKINSYITSNIRLYKPFGSQAASEDLYAQFAQWQTKIGPLVGEVGNSVGSLFRLSAAVKTPQKFVTYTNGFYRMKREYNCTAKLQANTYPLVGRAHLYSETWNDTLAVVTQRPMGMTAYNKTDSAFMEFTLHRRVDLLVDTRGNDISVMNDSVLVGIIKQATAPTLTAQTMVEFQTPPTLHFALLNSTSNWSTSCKTQWVPISAALPVGVHMLSMELLTAISSTEVEMGIRLINTDEMLAKSLDIGSLLLYWKLELATETTPDLQVVINANPCGNSQRKTCSVRLNSLQLRSFVLRLTGEQ